MKQPATSIEQKTRHHLRIQCVRRIPEMQLEHNGASSLLWERNINSLLESTPHSRVQLPRHVGRGCVVRHIADTKRTKKRKTKRKERNQEPLVDVMTAHSIWKHIPTTETQAGALGPEGLFLFATRRGRGLHRVGVESSYGSTSDTRRKLSTPLRRWMQRKKRVETKGVVRQN